MAKEQDIVQDALERFEESNDGSDYNREAAYEDMQFARMSDQWPEKVKKVRKDEGRPCLTINRLPSFIRQVVNDARQNKPGIMVGPVDGGADEATAQVIGGLVRGVERMSKADVAYDTAIDHACSGGFGFFRIDIDYVHPESFDLEARINRIPNPLMVHWDTNSTAADASDWDYAFISDFYTEDEFEKRYPDAQKVSFESDPRDSAMYWLEDDKIRVAEYWARSETPGEIVLLRHISGKEMVLRADEMADYAKSVVGEEGYRDDEERIMAAMAAGQMEEVRRRETMFKEVKRYVTNGVEILNDKGEEWPGSMIPICPVWGEEVFIDGRRHFRSMIRDAKDSQTMFNFWRTATTELVALAPKAPWVGPKGFTKGVEEQWGSANTRSHAFLEYEGATPPSREPFAGIPAGALQEALSAQDDMKAILGIYDSSLGAQSNETSGKAILARQRESDVSNFHFIDNLSRAIQYAGQVLVEIIPSVYSARETIRILGEDMAEKVVRLTTSEPGEINPETGERELYNIGVGKYDVTVKQGPSYATQREEAREVLLEVARSTPEAWLIMGDLLADNLDFVGADELKKRLQAVMAQRGIPVNGQMPQMPTAPAPQNGSAGPAGPALQ